MSNYYIAKPGTQQPMGPYSIDQIRAGIQQGTITPDCVYCAVGMQQWLPLSQLPGLNPKPASRPAMGAQPMGGGLNPAMGPRPSSGLAASIISTILCFPFGIPAIVNSARCNTFIHQGDYNSASKSAARAGMWRTIAFILGGIAWAINILSIAADM